MPLDLTRLRALAEAATPGEWSTGGIFDPHGPKPRTSIWGPIPPGMQSGEWIAKDMLLPDAEFAVATQPETILALIRIAEVAKKLFDAADAMLETDAGNEDWDALAAARDELQPLLAAMEVNDAH